MEHGTATVVFSTGMGAIASTLLALLRAANHLVSSQYLFANTNSLLKTIERLGVRVSFVDATDVGNVEAAITPRTRMVFVETIANPRTQVADLVRIGALCRRRGIIFFVDTPITSPYLFQPEDVGASLVINSLTKCIGGHGNALDGAVTDTGLFDWSTYANIYDEYKKREASTWGIQQIRKKGLRDIGASIAPDSAHRVAIGAETLACAWNARARTR